MTIKITEEQRNRFHEYFTDELDYKIFESGCADEYEDDIFTLIELLKVLDDKDMAESYKKDYEEKLKEDEEDV